MNFEELFSLYPCYLTETAVEDGIKTIIANHFEENNVQSVWEQCLHQIDLTTLNGDDTIEKVATLTNKVNEFNTHYPQLPNVAAICVYLIRICTPCEKDAQHCQKKRYYSFKNSFCFHCFTF